MDFLSRKKKRNVFRYGCMWKKCYCVFLWSVDIPVVPFIYAKFWLSTILFWCNDMFSCCQLGKSQFFSINHTFPAYVLCHTCWCKWQLYASHVAEFQAISIHRMFLWYDVPCICCIFPISSHKTVAHYRASLLLILRFLSCAGVDYYHIFSQIITV